MLVSASDYVANSTDEGVLKLAPKAELSPAQITNVFGFPRNLKTKVLAVDAPLHAHACLLLLTSHSLTHARSITLAKSLALAPLGG